MYIIYLLYIQYHTHHQQSLYMCIHTCGPENTGVYPQFITITINLGYFSHFRPMRRSEGSPGNGKTWTENLRGLFQSIGLGHSKMGKIMQSLGPLQFSANINWDCDPQNWFTSRIVFLSFVIRSSGAAFFGWSNIPLPELVQGTTRHSWRKSEADFG
jgi:hypothetical protein